MQSTTAVSRTIARPSQPDQRREQPRDLSPAVSEKTARRRPKEARSQPRVRTPDVDARTRMLLEQPIAPTILRLAIPNATVLLVQILIGLLEVYFVSRSGTDGLAGVSARLAGAG